MEPTKMQKVVIEGQLQKVHAYIAMTRLDSRQYVLCRAADFNKCSTSVFNQNDMTTRLTTQSFKYKKMRGRDDEPLPALEDP